MRERLSIYFTGDQLRDFLPMMITVGCPAKIGSFGAGAYMRPSGQSLKMRLFNVFHSLVANIRTCHVSSGTSTVRGSNFGRMPFLTGSHKHVLIRMTAALESRFAV